MLYAELMNFTANSGVGWHFHEPLKHENGTRNTRVPKNYYFSPYFIVKKKKKANSFLSFVSVQFNFNEKKKRKEQKRKEKEEKRNDLTQFSTMNYSTNQ